MKPFNLELAKAGHPVCTRDGRPVRILCYDLISRGNTPIVALVKTGEKHEDLFYYREDGVFLSVKDDDHPLNLMMVPEKKEGWMNIYENKMGVPFGGIIYESEEKAREHIEFKLNIYITTIKVEYEG